MEKIRIKDVSVGDLLECHCGCCFLLIVTHVDLTSITMSFLRYFGDTTVSHTGADFLETLHYYVMENQPDLIDGDLKKVG
mgnify:CR=1 FL=1